MAPHVLRNLILYPLCFFSLPSKLEQVRVRAPTRHRLAPRTHRPVVRVRNESSSSGATSPEAADEALAKFVERLTPDSLRGSNKTRLNNIVSRGSELEKLSALTTLIHDAKMTGAPRTFGESGMSGAHVSPGAFLEALNRESADEVKALENAMGCEACGLNRCDGDAEKRLECVIDKAYVNLGKERER